MSLALVEEVVMELLMTKDMDRNSKSSFGAAVELAPWKIMVMFIPTAVTHVFEADWTLHLSSKDWDW